MKFLSDLLKVFFNNAEKYDKIKNSEKAPVSVRLGVISILSSVLGTAISIALLVGGIYLLGETGNPEKAMEVPLLLLGGGVACLCGGALFIANTVRSITAAIFQLKLNRRAIGIISLILSIAVLTAAAVFILIQIL